MSPSCISEWQFGKYTLRLKTSPIGTLNGYVSWKMSDFPPIPEDHPLMQAVTVHRGLSYCQIDSAQQTIGFDCAHDGDITCGIENPEQYLDTDEQIRVAHPQPDEDFVERLLRHFKVTRLAAAASNLFHFKRPIDQELVEIHTIQLAGQMQLIHENVGLYTNEPELALANVFLGILERNLRNDPITNLSHISDWVRSLRIKYPKLTIE